MINGQTPSFTPAQQKKLLAEEWERKKQERRHAAIEATAKKHPKIARPEDRRIVATNLGEILDRFERAGKGKKERVLREANMGVEGNSTKQLYHYTLPPSYTAPEKRRSKLIRRADGYINLARKAAEIAAWDKKDILIELFRGTTYNSEVSHAAADLPDYVFSLHDILDRLNGWLLRETRISWYYEMLRRYPGISDDWGNFVVRFPTWPLPDNSVQSPAFYGKAIPGVSLYRILCAELPVEFVSKSDPLEGSDEPPTDAPIEQLIFRRYFDVRLGLAPVGASGNLRLVFDQRRVGEVWQVQEPADADEGKSAIEKWRAYSPIWFLPAPFSKTPKDLRGWSPSDFHGAFDPPNTIVEDVDDSYDEIGLFGGWIRFTTLDHDPIPQNELFPIAAPNRHEAVSRAIQDQFVEEVEPSTCKKYLDRKIDKHIRRNWNTSMMPLECPADTIAATIESALYSDDVENRLDTLLKKAIEHHCSILELCLERRNNVIAENKQKLFSRWRASKSTGDME